LRAVRTLRWSGTPWHPRWHSFTSA
jgi:hypothetical protein